MNSSSWIVMAVAFLATLMLVLALYPVIVSYVVDKEQRSLKVYDLSRIDERRQKWTVSLFVGSVVMCLFFLFRVELWATVLLSVFSGFLCGFALNQYFRARRKKRDALFELRMLDFLVLVGNNLRAGFALPMSIEMASKSIGGHLEAGFNTMLSEYRLGIELSESIRRMTSRIQSENLQLFAATITISIQTGSPVATVLDRLIYTMRKRNEMTDKLKAAVAQFRFEAFVMSFFPFIAFGILYYLSPKLMSPMITTTLGWVTIAGIILLELVGLQILKKICHIKM